MADQVLVDAGFLVALLSRRDRHHEWSVDQAARHGRPWLTCEAVLSEAVHLLGRTGVGSLCALLERNALISSFNLQAELPVVVRLLSKYENLPCSLADACLVRMSELYADCVLLTTDFDFRVYRRHGRRVIPSVLPDRD